MTPGKSKKRRRTCWDRLRRWAREQQRQRRKKKTNPAAVFLFQIAALLLLLLPPLPEAAPQPMQRPHPKPRRKRRPAAVPAKSAAPAYTRYDRNGWPSRYKGESPTFSRLLRDVQRPYREEGGPGKLVHEDAIQALTAKVEPDVRPWLDHIILDGRWSDLAAVIRLGMSENQIHEAMLEAAFAWTRAEREATTVIGPEPADGGDGGAGTGERPTETVAPDDPTKKGPK